MNRILREYLFNVFIGFLCLLAAFLCAELIVRDYKAGFKNMIMQEGGNLLAHHFNGLYHYDAELGWVPAPNTAKEKWRTTVHTIDHGIRSNGTNIPLDESVRIMALGDSFTFGDEVSDSETWPALLERLLRHPVLNAGVSSYGLDQIVLRAEKLIPIYKPDIAIIRVIFDDFQRCKQSVRHGVPKPYVTKENGQLVVKNQPVPFKETSELDLFRKIAGYSHLAHRIMSHSFPTYWWKDTMQDYQYVSNSVDQVAAYLLARLAKLDSKARIVILISDNKDVSQERYIAMTNLIEEIQARIPSLEIYNVMPQWLTLKKNKPEEFESLFLPQDSSRHLSPKGNAFIAAIAKKIIEEKKISD